MNNIAILILQITGSMAAVYAGVSAVIELLPLRENQERTKPANLSIIQLLISIISFWYLITV